MVRTVGIEPTWEAHTPLKRTRLPISPRPQLFLAYKLYQRFDLISRFFIINCMDKRQYLGKRRYTMSNGKTFDVLLYKKTNARRSGVSIRACYGVMEAYLSDNISFSFLDKMVSTSYNHYKDYIFDRPFMKEGVYIYMLGKKRYFTTDSTKKDNDLYFYIPPTCKDPIVKYKKMFLEYLHKRIIELGDIMSRDLRSYIIRTGLFISYYGVCFPTKKQFKFDYRLFAYKKELIDTILIHEIAHTYEIHHNERFYSIVKMYCKDYDYLVHELERGKFDGELDNYVF